MRTRVLLVGLALSLTAATGLSACGSGGDSSGDSGGSSGSSSSSNSKDDYCKELKTDAAFFKSLEDGDTKQLQEAFDKFHQLADDAPDAVAADWKTLDGAISTVEKALKDAGVSSDDLAAIQKGQIPKGVDAQKLQQLGPKLQSLGDEKFAKASKAIEAHAKTECKIDISGS